MLPLPISASNVGLIIVARYTNQIVVFIDLLGFSNMLQTFEDEALANSLAQEESYHESVELNKLISIFENSLALIEQRNCTYYQFSDNICITINYINEGVEHAELFIEIIQLINILNYEFIQQGYFIRGGVDAGWFLEDKKMAIGTPLAEAYRLESKVAIHPRVMISAAYRKLLQQLIENGAFTEEQLFLIDKILKEDSENAYIDSFTHVLAFEDPLSKRNFLNTYREKIVSSIALHKDNTKVLPKYEWSANAFNEFIDNYITNHHHFEIENALAEEDVQTLQELKITYEL